MSAKRTPLVVHRSDFKRVIVTDAHPDTSYLEQKEFTADRRAYQRGQFSFVGLRARIELKIPCQPEGHAICHEVESPGLWGIQTNSNDTYFDEVFRNEADILEHMLTTLGVKVQP
jgi:hypothetical protein